MTSRLGMQRDKFALHVFISLAGRWPLFVFVCSIWKRSLGYIWSGRGDLVVVVRGKRLVVQKHDARPGAQQRAGQCIVDGMWRGRAACPRSLLARPRGGGNQPDGGQR